mgnify:CR=1 FL=1
MIKVQSEWARKVLEVEVDEEIRAFLRASEEYFGPAKLIGYEGLHEVEIRKKLTKIRSKNERQK